MLSCRAEVLRLLGSLGSLGLLSYLNSLGYLGSLGYSKTLKSNSFLHELSTFLPQTFNSQPQAYLHSNRILSRYSSLALVLFIKKTIILLIRLRLRGR